MHLDSHVIKMGTDRNETAFTSIMGHMDVIPIVSNGLNVYLPIVMCVFCVATFLEFGTRFLHFMGIEQFIIDDEMTGDLIRDGQELVKREKTKRGKTSESRWRSNRWNVSGAARQATEEIVVSDASSIVLSPEGDSRTAESARLELLNDTTSGYNSTGRTPDHTAFSRTAPQRNIFDDV